MRVSHALSCILVLLLCQKAFSQSFIEVDLNTNRFSQSEEAFVSGHKTIRIKLPEAEYKNARIQINSVLFSFDCERFGGKQGPSCFQLYLSDIDSGCVYFNFKDKTLAGIGRNFTKNKTELFNKKTELLTGTDTLYIVNLKKAGDTVKLALPFVAKTKKPDQHATDGAVDYRSSFCSEKSEDTSTLSPFPDFSFLCPGITNKKCDCGILVRSPFENIYLPPCFDTNGNALSIKNHLLYDMSATDPLQTAFLFEVTKSKKINPSGCPSSVPFQFASIRTKMCPSVNNILAVSVIAPRDSMIVIDSNYTNYFLDSAAKVQGAFTAAGSGKIAIEKGANKDSLNSSKDSQNILTRQTVALRNDLVYFNNYYQNLNFIQEKYKAQLACIQVKISEVYRLQNIPKSGTELVADIDAVLMKNKQFLEQYSFIICSLLKQIGAEYDTALNRKGKYRVFTKLFQIPNADEISIGIKTKSTTLYRHNFLIRNGWKIDFSTGVFVNGLNSVDYSLTSTRYKVRTNPTDSLRDTTGNFIQKNKHRLNYNTGFLVHVYKRSGSYINQGIVAGVNFNNSEFNLLLGGSIMFRMGNARFSFVGGFAFGREKTLDANHRQYELDGKPPADSQFFVSQVPRFLPDANISTYDSFKTSWFFGISYNFASIKFP